MLFARTILFFIFLCLSAGAMAQLDYYRQDIVADKGMDYTTGMSDTIGSYICYDGATPSAPLLLTTCYHFENGNGKCYLVKKMYLASYAPDLIKIFKETLVQLEPMVFRDAATNTNFFLYVKGSVLVLDVMRGK